ncbi:MAG: hypothetical protein JWO65_1126 [Sphingomonas bacterium]|nr:hypothetical protein [Sphingomonas bacterium]
MTTSTILILGAIAFLLILVLLLLARTGRKPPEGPAVLPEDGMALIDPAVELSPVLPDELLPELGTPIGAGISTAELEPSTPPMPDGPADPLTRMKGLGPKAEAVLNGLGVTHYAQIAAWREDDVARIDAQMGAFKGRIVRDRWVEQAGYLAAGDIAGFEAVFGKLG